MSERPGLLVVVADSLSAFIAKGEITPRYYNPGEVFGRVALLLTQRDSIDPALLQKTVGNADLTILHAPCPSFSASWGWQPRFLRSWIAQGVSMARSFGPQMIRAYGNYENGYLAAHIRREIQAPLTVSLHINPDEDLRKGIASWRNWKERVMLQRRLFFEKITLVAADRVLPVYEPIREYAVARGARHVQVCYNVIHEQMNPKTSYQTGSLMKCVSVGRQFAQKNPISIIKAAAQLPVSVTFIGDGPYHERLRQAAKKTGQEHKFVFIRAMPNEQLSEQLRNFDAFVIHSQYYEMGKALMEAALAGLPIVLNRRNGKAVPEISENWVRLVENSSQGYYTAIKGLLEKESERQRLGQAALNRARALFLPAQAECAYADVYRSLLRNGH